MVIEYDYTTSNIFRNCCVFDDILVLKRVIFLFIVNSTAGEFEQCLQRRKLLQKRKLRRKKQ